MPASPKYPATACSNKKPQSKLFPTPTISRCPSSLQMTPKSSSLASPYPQHTEKEKSLWLFPIGDL